MKKEKTAKDIELEQNKVHLGLLLNLLQMLCEFKKSL